MYNLNESFKKLKNKYLKEAIDINQYPLTLEFFKTIDDFISKNYPSMKVEDVDLKNNKFSATR